MLNTTVGTNGLMEVFWEVFLYTNENPSAYTREYPIHLLISIQILSSTVMSFKFKESDMFSITNFIFCTYLFFLLSPIMGKMINTSLSTGLFSDALRPKDICIHLDAAEEHGTNIVSLPASYRMMSG